MLGIVRFCVDRPKTVTIGMGLVTVVLALLAALPSLAPERFSFLHAVEVDTDPENMLPADEPVRVFHRNMKKLFGLHDMVVVGVLNPGHPEGVFNVKTLRKVHDLAEFAKGLTWENPEDPDGRVGVIAQDLLALSTVDNVESAGLGAVKFEWLMPKPPATAADAEAVREKAGRLPLLAGTLVSEVEEEAEGEVEGDGAAKPPRATALYIPITDKDLSFRVATALQEKIATYPDDGEEYHITGLPVAEDTFGVEMFTQMGISAPVAMIIIFLLMAYFFRKLSLIVSPLIVAMACVIQTMGLLVATGHTIHIMSSMIPIFIIPIAVLDAIHILSEFFDRYQETGDRRATMLSVMETLFSPMLYTSLTTAVGFASLALTPIPPVQIFGLFVAFGVFMAWFWTITFIPAAVMFISKESLEGFGLTSENEAAEARSPMARLLGAVGRMTFGHARMVGLVTAAVAAASIYGITQIRINDNPIKWFEPEHPIRVADQKLNAQFAGTYMAYLALSATDAPETAAEALAALRGRLPEARKQLTDAGYEQVDAVFQALEQEAASLAADTQQRDIFLDRLEGYAQGRADAKETADAVVDTWTEAATFVSAEKQRVQVFKDPALLEWVRDLQAHLHSITDEGDRALVGKSSSVADVVCTVYRELTGGDAANYRIPERRQGVAQTLMQYQNSHRPQDLWHFVESPDEAAAVPGYRKASLWVQLKSGDNRDMERVVAQTAGFFDAHPPPQAIEPAWFGLTYINVVWQDKMVKGMLIAFLGSFLAVLLMMMVLFRSALWGLLCMVPLAVTIGLIYGLVGLVGKDYDMPVAVLSSLSLGLAVDYAIHFLARSRELRAREGAWQEAVGAVFGEPARAITRNVLVVGVGFLPLLAAPLVPYQTVGLFIAAILLAAGAATLFILPALIKGLEPLLFPATDQRAFLCKCGTCIFSVVVALGLVAVNVVEFLKMGVTDLTYYSAAALAVLFALCCSASRRASCRPSPSKGPRGP